MFIQNKKEGRKATNSFIKLGVIFSLTFLFLFSFSSALDSAGIYKVNQAFNFTQPCSDATYVTLDLIKTPSGTSIIDTNMTAVGSGTFLYSYTPTEIGRHFFEGISDGCEGTFATYIDVTPNGFVNSISFYILILVLSLGIIILGFAMQDAPITILGSLGLYFIGLYILFYGLVGMKDTVYTWGIGIIILGLAFYISTKSAHELIAD